jgi:Spy/CpxP family protein refolding chaperone
MKIRNMIPVLAILAMAVNCSKPKSEAPQGMAEGPRQDRMSPQERVDRLAVDLNLSDDQKAKVLDLFSKEAKSYRKPGHGTEIDREAVKAEMERKRAELNEKMKGILTVDQFAQYGKLMSERPESGRHKMMNPQEQVDRLAEQLTLTGSQKTELLDVFTKEAEAFQNLAPEARVDREAMKTAMEKVRAEFNEKIRAVLTKDQFAQYEKMMMNEMPRGLGEEPPPPSEK